MTDFTKGGDISVFSYHPCLYFFPLQIFMSLLTPMRRVNKTLLFSYKCSHFIPLSLTVHSVKIREQSFRRQSRMILSLILFSNHLNIYTHLCTHILVLEHSHKPEYKLSGVTSKKCLEIHLKEKFHNLYNMS